MLSKERLNEIVEQAKRLGKQYGVSPKAAQDELGYPVTKEQLDESAKSDNAVGQQLFRSFLETWLRQIKQKKGQIDAMRQQTPKSQTAPLNDKLLDGSTDERTWLTDEERKLVVSIHNKWRKDGYINSFSKADLEYDDKLAFHAQLWANSLVMSRKTSHNPNRKVGEYDETGENIAFSYTSGARTKKMIIKDAIDDWVGESKKYDLRTHQATPPTAVVGHYTQVVWQSTKKVGCGVALVTDADKATTAYCVCVYYPAGNYERQFRENV